MKTLLELQPLIIEWAKERNIHLLECAPKQRLKLLEEVGETAKAILKNDVKEIKDGLGDTFVVLVILAEQLDADIIFDLDDFSDDSKEYVCKLFFEILDVENIEESLSYLNDICKKLDYNLEECANIAWNEIKDRKGKTINGTFIKN